MGLSKDTPAERENRKNEPSESEKRRSARLLVHQFLLPGHTRREAAFLALGVLVKFPGGEKEKRGMTRLS